MKNLLTIQWIVLASSIGANAFAGEHGVLPLLPSYKQECASCHVPYAPAHLPAQSWQRIMSNLSHHFGNDATLDAAQVKEISAWLAQGASSRKPAPPDDRITRSSWFVREHDEVPAAAWKRPSVKSASNCAACHTQADQGDFSERNIRIPR